MCDKAEQVHCEGPRKGDYEFTMGSQGAPVSGFAIRGFPGGFHLGLGESSSSCRVIMHIPLVISST